MGYLLSLGILLSSTMLIFTHQTTTINKHFSDQVVMNNNMNVNGISTPSMANNGNWGSNNNGCSPFKPWECSK